jgi:RNA polymerase primary sigma factor
MENEELLRIYFNQIRSIPLLDFEGETELSRLVQKGNKDALHKLITANLRLVVKIARLYMAQNVPFIDLVQEGNMGLIHAAEKYDHMKKVRFCTYASWWIRQFIIRYLTNKRRIVRLPQRKEEMLRRIQHTYHILSQTLMHQPRSEDIAKELGISVHDVDFVINMSSGSLPLEWDGNDRQSNVPSFEFQEEYTYNPEKTFMRNYHREGAWRCLENLKDKEKQVLTYRYQLEGSGPRTLKEIGAKMDISPETVRKIEMRALAKIRSRADELKKHGIMKAI